MMRSALLLVGATLISSQDMACFGLPADACVFAISGKNCSIAPARCNRIAAPCPTGYANIGCNASENCGAGTLWTNANSCSTCADMCFGHTSNASCMSDTNALSCSWTPASCYPNSPPPMIYRPCDHSSSAICLAEAGCSWIDFTSNICGMPTRTSSCVACNESRISLPIRSAVKNNEGKTCTFVAAPPYVTAFILTVHAYQQSSDLVNCPAVSAASGTDIVTLFDAVKAGFFSRGTVVISSESNASCVTPTSAPTGTPTPGTGTSTPTGTPTASGGTPPAANGASQVLVWSPVLLLSALLF